MYDVVSIAAALLCMISIFLPFGRIGLTYYGESGKSEGSLDYSAYDIGMQSASNIRYFARINGNDAREMLREIPGKILSDKNGYREYGDTVYLTTLISAARTDVTVLNLIISFASLFVLLFSASFIYKKLAALALGKEEKPTGAAKAFALILSILLLLLAIVVVLITKTAISGNVARYVKYTVGAGPIISIVSAILMIKFSKYKRKKREAISYDDPDVSYAPYVIDDTRGA